MTDTLQSIWSKFLRDADLNTAQSEAARVAFEEIEKVFNERWTRNETIELMHEDTALAFKKTADFIEKHKPGLKYIVELLRDISDEKEAQSIVVSLRDKL